MGHKSPAKILRAVKRITKFLQLKRLILSKVVLPCIDIAPYLPKLSIAHVQTTIIPAQPKPSSPVSNSHIMKNILPVTSYIPMDPLPDDVHAQPGAGDLPEPAVIDGNKKLDELTQREFIAIFESVFKPP